MNFQDVEQITYGHYKVNVSWGYLEDNLKQWTKNYGLELQPDFQRAHVWTDDQRIKYVEWILRGGNSGRDVYFNCPGWMHKFNGSMVLVDGLQRITAVLMFLHNEIPAFGLYRKDWEGKLSMTGPDFIFVVNDLPTRESVLKWYLNMNSGGTVHTEAELNKVRDLLMEEMRKNLKGEIK